MHKQKSSFKCDKCQLVLADKKDLDNHRLECGNDKAVFKCSICEKTFGNSDELRVHQEDHNNLKEFKCNYCDKNILASNEMEALQNMQMHNEKCPCKPKVSRGLFMSSL